MALPARRRAGTATPYGAGGRRDGDNAQLEKWAALRSWKFHYGQGLAWKALHHDHYEVVSIMAGTGGGKTYAGPRLLYPIIRSGLDKKHLWVEPTWRMVKRIMVPEVVPFLDSFGLGQMHLGDMVYEFKAGGRIFFGSVDNPNSLQGNHIDGSVWGDEVGLYSEEAFDVLMQRRALHRAPCLYTSTPYTLPWVERRLSKPAQPGHPDSALYRLIQFPSYWNPMYSLDEYWRLKRTWPKDKFDRLMRGEFTRIGGLCFGELNEERHLATIHAYPDRRLLHFRHPREGERLIRPVRAWASMDWGWTDEGCLLVYVQDDRGRIYTIEEDYESGVPFALLANPTQGDTWTTRILARLRRWGLEAVYCDPSRPENIKAWQALGIPAEPAINDHGTGFDAVNQALHTAHEDGSAGLYIAGNTCTNLVRTSGSYVRAKAPGSDQYLDRAADGQEDHACDSFRYGLTKGKRPNKPAPAGGEPDILPGRRRAA